MHFFHFTVKEHIAYIALNRPESLNAFHSPMIEEFLDLFQQISTDSSIYCVLIHSTLEKVFSAGGDIKEESQLREDAAALFSQQGQACVFAIEHCPVPVIIAIQGHTLGAGFELMLGCDIVIAAEDIKLGIPTIRLGEIPAWGSTQRLPRLLGKSTASDLLLTGRALTAQEALRLNLVQYVTTKDLLFSEATALAKEIASKAPIAVKAMKSAISAAMTLPPTEGFQKETQLFVQTCATEDRQEAMQAFLEKRLPTPFQNR